MWQKSHREDNPILVHEHPTTEKLLYMLHILPIMTYIKKQITITVEQDSWLKRNYFNLSSMVRGMLEDRIKRELEEK